jgi:hypothetical protein
MHDAPQDVLVEAYPEEEYWQDLLKVTGGLTNEKFARMAIRASSTFRPWMRKQGVNFQPSLSGGNAFFMGGGTALVNAYYRSAEQLGVHIRYESPVERLDIENGRFIGPAGLLWLNLRRHPIQGDVKQQPMDRGFIMLLLLTSATGLALLALRNTQAMGLLLAVHLGVVMARSRRCPMGSSRMGSSAARPCSNGQSKSAVRRTSSWRTIKRCRRTVPACQHAKGK